MLLEAIKWGVHKVQSNYRIDIHDEDNEALELDNNVINGEVLGLAMFGRPAPGYLHT